MNVVLKSGWKCWSQAEEYLYYSCSVKCSKVWRAVRISSISEKYKLVGSKGKFTVRFGKK